MCGLNCAKVNYLSVYDRQDMTDPVIVDIDNLFGFFYCEIETPNNIYLGLLPFRTKTGIEFPLGKWSGWYFSEELKFAKEHGYEIQVIKGYNFDYLENVFVKFVEELYDKRLNSNGIAKIINKIILNSGFGRFGLSIIKPETDILYFYDLQALFFNYE